MRAVIFFFFLVYNRAHGSLRELELSKGDIGDVWQNETCQAAIVVETHFMLC